MSNLRSYAVALLLITRIGSAVTAEDAPPQIVPDPSSDDWVVDRLAGNTSAGPVFLQGPAREAGGLGRCGACPLPDRRVLIPFHDGLAELDAEGNVRLVAEGQFLFGTTGQVTANVMAFNPRDQQVYVAGANCVRRLIERNNGPWRVEVVAGIPCRAGFDDGPLTEATFTRIDSIVINSRGTVFILDGNKCIRKIADGHVSTITAAVSSGPEPIDGPLEEARFHMIGLGGNLTGGENDDVLYLSDHWNFAVRRIDLKANEVTTVAGMPKSDGEKSPRSSRFNSNADGPARTWASFNSGCAYVCWDPVHAALWCGGPDEHRFRWLKDKELRTVIGANGAQWPWDDLGVPATKVRMTWNAVVAVDDQGRVFLNCSENPTGLWRAYNSTERKPQR